MQAKLESVFAGLYDFGDIVLSFDAEEKSKAGRGVTCLYGRMLSITIERVRIFRVLET